MNKVKINIEYQLSTLHQINNKKIILIIHQSYRYHVIILHFLISSILLHINNKILFFKIIKLFQLIVFNINMLIKFIKSA